jgi:hypothetical protein
MLMAFMQLIKRSGYHPTSQIMEKWLFAELQFWMGMQNWYLEKIMFHGLYPVK